MSEFFSVLSALSFILSLAAAFASVRTAILVRELREASPSSVLLQMRSVRTSLEETQSALEALANRVKMQRVRAATDHATGPARSNGGLKMGADGLPDPYAHPNEWRTAMNAKLGGFPG